MYQPTTKSVVDSNLQPSTQRTLSVHIVEKEDIFFSKGHNLAQAVYQEVWNTENLVDGHDYGIVVTYNGKVLGNANLQIKKPGKLLKSEVFFGKSHWKEYFEVSELEIAEISALAVSKNAPAQMRRLILMMLIVGIQNLCRIINVRQIATMQHDYLIRILTKALHLPFYRNETIEQPQATNLLHDDYWKKIEPPALYYLDPLGNEVTAACYSFLNYIHLSGMQTSFSPRLNNIHKLSYATFCKF